MPLKNFLLIIARNRQYGYSPWLSTIIFVVTYFAVDGSLPKHPALGSLPNECEVEGGLWKQKFGKGKKNIHRLSDSHMVALR